MVKLILCLTFLLFSVSTFAKECAVYGISDSPQFLNCSFGKVFRAKLHCDNGRYYLNSSKVLVAFHLEVESGLVPLIFKTSDSILKILFYSKRNIKAYLKRSGHEQIGQCT